MADRYKRMAPLAGVLFVAVVVVALSLGGTPDTSASPARVVEWYRHHHTAAIASSLLLSYAGLLVLVYFAAAASFLRRRGADVLATTAVAGAAIAATGMLVSAGLNGTLVDRTGHLNAGAAQALNYLQNDAFAPLLFGGMCAATLSVGVAILRTRALPKWLGIVTTIDGVALGTGVVSWFGFLASGVIMLITSGYLYRQLGKPTQIALPGIPAARSGAETPVAEESTAGSS